MFYRTLYLRSLAAIFLCAFMSFYLQFPGTLGRRGLLPADTFLENVESSVMGPPSEDRLRTIRSYGRFPSLMLFRYSVVPDMGIDTCLELLCLIAIFLCVLGSTGKCLHIFLFGYLYLAYLTLFLTGQRFLGFQWDIFLLETGAMSLLYCPLFSVRPTTELPPTAWLLRLLWVKFMFMSGTVKVTAGCPTWQRLTALEYHFASTCIPCKEAWWLHSLNPFILRSATAHMFVSEIVAPWLLLVPVLAVRRLGVLLQVPLQIGIMLTGNYNWFNLHTMALLIPAWAPDSASPPSTVRKVLSATSVVASLVALCAVSVSMFTVEVKSGVPYAALWDDPDGLKIFSHLTPESLARVSEWLLGKSGMGCMLGLVAWSCARWTAAAPPRKLRLTLAVLYSACVLMASALCLLPYRDLGYKEGVNALVPKWVQEMSRGLHPWQLSNSYGLFRSMTGVGQKKISGAKGWGGQPPSIVEVPALAVEGQDIKTGKWKEIPLRFTPGTPDRAPRRTAPHQPRLDWQMWFAALNPNFQSEPFAIHLAFKLLLGESEVYRLVDTDAQHPFSPTNPPKAVRMQLYHYDFTRTNTTWARRLGDSVTISGTEWWRRKLVSEWMPPLSLDNQNLRKFIEQNGWPTEKEKKEKCTHMLCGPVRAVGLFFDVNFRGRMELAGGDTNMVFIGGVCLMGPLLALAVDVLISIFVKRDKDKLKKE